MNEKGQTTNRELLKLGESLNIDEKNALYREIMARTLVDLTELVEELVDYANRKADRLRGY